MLTPLPNNPLQFLVYLNWVLLLIILVPEFFALLGFTPLPGNPLLNLSCVFVFAIMGFQLPLKKKRLFKYAYIAGEFLSIFLCSFIGWIKFYPLMYLILVIRNNFILPRKSRLVVTGIVFICFAITEADRFDYKKQIFKRVLSESKAEIFFITFSISTTILFGLVLFFLQLLVDAFLAEYQSRQKLSLANEQLRKYALRIEDIATLQERNRIAREIHDSLGHSLTIFNMHLEAGLKLLDSDLQEAKELLKEAKQVGTKSLNEVRQSVAALRADPFRGIALTDAIAKIIDDFQRSTTISPQIYITISRSIPDDVKVNAYRILQEALTNICKHARAKEVTITVETITNLNLTIEDNGVGFNLELNTSGFGLQGMQERTQALGGNFQIITAPDCGCKIIVSLPLPWEENLSF